MTESRISGLYKLSVRERIVALERLGWLSSTAARDLQSGRQVLSAVDADKLIENVVGVFGLPLAIAPNFVINGRDCLVPLVVEEPSIVAGLSAAAALARETGGYRTACDESLLAGQIHVTNVSSVDSAVALLRDSSDALLAAANAVHPRLLARGGGVRELEFRALQLPDGAPLVATHVLVDTCDAMGANLVNTICESIAPTVAAVCGGDVALRILSNLTDRSMVRAEVRYPAAMLATDGMSGEQVRDRIVQANDIARVDPYRAATHNKGIMNGIDAVAIATGNDWRAIEASVHAYAARAQRYSELTRWSVASSGELLGEICLPLKVGIVGGTLQSNPAAALGLAIAGVRSATQLAEMMAAVGLAQNFAALRALAGNGIQEGHMRLHARSVAASVGTPDDHLDEVVARLVASGEVKRWKAEEILGGVTAEASPDTTDGERAAGKVILFGEHAVVYGKHALALPLTNAVSAVATAAADKSTLLLADRGLKVVVDRDASNTADAAVSLILAALDVADRYVDIVVRSWLPRGMGLGSSAAIAVAMIRAVARCFAIDVSDTQVNEIAFSCEKLAHGTPSGIDNTVACFARPALYRNVDGAVVEPFALTEPPPLLIALSRDVGLTHEQVAGVRRRYDKSVAAYEAVFEQMSNLALEGAKALQTTRYDELGAMMNVCHGLLNAIEVSTPDIENMVKLARRSGAVGAKLTGAGGGGAIVALCPGTLAEVRAAFLGQGYEVLQMDNSREMGFE